MYSKKMNIWLELLISVKIVPAIITIIIEKIKVDRFYKNADSKIIEEVQFKNYIKRYFSDVYNVDKLEFMNVKLKDYHIDLVDLMVILQKLNQLSPGYNVARRYFGILKLIECEKIIQNHANKKYN
jgi:hypothetical protein